MCKTLGIALLSSVVALWAPLPALSGGINIGGSKRVSVDVSTSDGLGVDASVGGRSDLNASANVGGSGGLANVDASVGGSRGVSASADVNGGRGLSVDVDAQIGGSGSTGTGSGILTGPQRQALRDMSPPERQRLLIRCGSITSSGYDPALVDLCRLLRLSAAR